MNPIILVIIPLISALIGWITNYLAVKMIFRPHKEISFLGLKIQGILPKRKKELAQRIGETVERELISHDDLQKAMDNPEFHKELTESVTTAIKKVITEKLASNPMIAMFLTGETMEAIMVMLAEEIESQVPTFMEKMFAKMEEHINFKDIVRQKVEEFEMDRLETIVYDIASKELKSIEILGAILGGIVGIVQVGIFALLGN